MSYHLFLKYVNKINFVQKIVEFFSIVWPFVIVKSCNFWLRLDSLESYGALQAPSLEGGTLAPTSARSNNIYTLYNAILRIARNFLETRENIKISTHPFYHTNLDWFSWEWSKKKFFFWRKKFKMADFSKWLFFKIANSQNFFVKISWIGPWVSRIDWCEGH